MSYISTMRTFKTVLDEKGFVWDDKKELWIKRSSFGRKVTVDLMFKKLFIITDQGGKRIHDNFVESLEEFESIMETI